jgi:hypothetical protein
VNLILACGLVFGSVSMAACGATESGATSESQGALAPAASSTPLVLVSGHLYQARGRDSEAVVLTGFSESYDTSSAFPDSPNEMCFVGQSSDVCGTLAQGAAAKNQIAKDNHVVDNIDFRPSDCSESGTGVRATYTLRAADGQRVVTRNIAPCAPSSTDFAWSLASADRKTIKVGVGVSETVAEYASPAEAAARKNFCFRVPVADACAKFKAAAQSSADPINVVSCNSTPTQTGAGAIDVSYTIRHGSETLAVTRSLLGCETAGTKTPGG